MSASNAYENLPDDVREAAVRLNALLREANEQACLVVHRLAVARGHQQDQEYEATPAERPWHDDVISPIWRALRAVEENAGVPILSPRQAVRVERSDAP